MLEIGVFHNGASSLPVITTKDGVTLNDGSLAEVHRTAQETLINQVRQGILAEKLGFQSFCTRTCRSASRMRVSRGSCLWCWVPMKSCASLKPFPA
jgi:hypothetical protein